MKKNLRICRLCLNPFNAPTCNTLYCTQCKKINAEMSRKKHQELCKESELMSVRQKILNRFNYYIYRSKRFKKLSKSEKSQIINLRQEFIDITKKLLRQYFGYSKGGGVRFDLEDDIKEYLAETEAELNEFLESH